MSYYEQEKRVEGVEGIGGERKGPNWLMEDYQLEKPEKDRLKIEQAKRNQRVLGVAILAIGLILLIAASSSLPPVGLMVVGAILSILIAGAILGLLYATHQKWKSERNLQMHMIEMKDMANAPERPIAVLSKTVQATETITA